MSAISRPREVADALECVPANLATDEATSPGQEKSGSGNMFGSDGKRSRVGDAGWELAISAGQGSLAIACIPVSLIFYKAWTFDVKSYAIGRVWV